MVRRGTDCRTEGYSFSRAKPQRLVKTVPHLAFIEAGHLESDVRQLDWPDEKGWGVGGLVTMFSELFVLPDLRRTVL